MYLEAAKEVVRFALKGPLLQPQPAPVPEGKFGLIVPDLAEAFRLYDLPLRKRAEADKLALNYLPDAAAMEQGKLTEFGSRDSNITEVALVMKERIRMATKFRIGRSHPDLDNEVDGALCAILEGRLARGNTIPLFEKMFEAYQYGYWPFGIKKAGTIQLLAVYVGGVKLDNAALDLQY